MLNLIKKKIKNQIKIKKIKITNQSSVHKNLKKKYSHFKIIIISNYFFRKEILERHRTIYNILSKEIKNKIHGIELYTYTEKEWNIKKNKKINPTKCFN
ncbi:MAG: BolA/IbaG family iron-sulfur metabolism protein [Buchnera aphidicola (Periphyllus lyropictus)]|uniref:BolA/IbaG family iron-sulfur metabolism protein n=1 Tax=Buchnera aphidicola TaxID=9 RepID=UPI001EBAFDB1|nr:BolA/IbaG family iron-sulfur metabolism protein [Buchnera aphidicola]NIH16518.1 BolA/IbaG family iron-sulfur metabolism protein [Buchnera aphidicola (Periphyllus lyropictus)]USS94802.1 BolA/IbaG family iron-sulfur metabolism protein [Buchnera aphidicola (Periphyllus lyropictus)]